MRAKVRAFAEVMEAKLRENQHKGGWEGEDWDWLLCRLREEADELEELCKRGPGLRAPWGPRTRTRKRNIARECADVANFAMMIADVCGGLP